MAKILALKVEKMTMGGQGIGYINGKVCFVDRVIPGEIIQAEIFEEKRDYSIAKAMAVINPSPHRLNPACPIFNRCGGCQLQHISYKHQLDLKKKIFLDSLRHIGKIEANIDDFIYKDDIWYYRNRAQLPVQNKDNLKIGYFQSGTHKVIDQKTCLINHRLINSALPALRERIRKSNITIYDEPGHKGNLRHIIIKVGHNTNQVLISFVSKEKDLPKAIYEKLDKEIKGLVGITQNVNPLHTNRILGPHNHSLFGQNYYEEHIDSKVFRIGPSSFFQINTPVFKEVLKEIKNSISLTGKEVVLDLYAGIGVIGIYLGERASQVIAIEESLDAVKDGIVSAEINKIKNLQFITNTVADGLRQIKNADIAILDPPRKGISKEVVEQLVKLKIKKIVYLACDPATFARDAKQLIEKNYRMEKIFFFDMFPQTYHIESLTIFAS